MQMSWVVVEPKINLKPKIRLKTLKLIIQVYYEKSKVCEKC